MFENQFRNLAGILTAVVGILYLPGILTNLTGNILWAAMFILLGLIIRGNPPYRAYVWSNFLNFGFQGFMLVIALLTYFDISDGSISTSAMLTLVCCHSIILGTYVAHFFWVMRKKKKKH
ncbi:hypothetical protein CF651_03755 [Paenibacillus rigui]|uniref:Uncharacterized protein n=2 Tax=Paenibacillus rigui TaxID=554312 RepID=A0A229UYL7_9BACL|nr:hypothetical protein CF651_03755 [Paenibacillus rigui]